MLYKTHLFLSGITFKKEDGKGVGAVSSSKSTDHDERGYGSSSPTGKSVLEKNNDGFGEIDISGKNFGVSGFVVGNSHDFLESIVDTIQTGLSGFGAWGDLITGHNYTSKLTSRMNYALETSEVIQGYRDRGVQGLATELTGAVAGVAAGIGSYSATLAATRSPALAWGSAAISSGAVESRTERFMDRYHDGVKNVVAAVSDLGGNGLVNGHPTNFGRDGKMELVNRGYGSAVALPDSFIAGTFLGSVEFSGIRPGYEQNALTHMAQIQTLNADGTTSSFYSSVGTRISVPGVEVAEESGHFDGVAPSSGLFGSPSGWAESVGSFFGEITNELGNASNYEALINNSHIPSGLLRPIILDLDGLGISVTELSQSTIFVDGGDGLEHRTAWAGAGDGVLFFDADGSGDISEQREYVFTEWDPTATSDLEALRSVFDTNGDGRLTNADTTWSQFRVARTEPDGTLSYHTLDALGITEIDLISDATNIELPDGSVITGQTTFTMNGQTHTVGEMTLATDGRGYRLEETESSNGGVTTRDANPFCQRNPEICRTRIQ